MDHVAGRRYGSMEKLLERAVVGAFAVTLLLSVFLPIYTDEVGWKILQARFFLDGGVNINLFPQCGAPFATAPAWFMVPARAFDAWLYGDLVPPLQLRFMGIASFLLWLAVAGWLLSRAVGQTVGGLSLVSLTVAFVGLGVMPFLMVINRPEQPLLIGLTVLMLAPLVAANHRARWPRDAAMAGGTVALCVFLFSQHPKSLLFLPLMAAAIFFLVERWSLRAAAYVALGYFALGTYGYWAARNQCPGDPVLAKAIATQLVPVSAILSDPLGSAVRMADNALHSWQWPRSTLFWYYYGSDWFPRTETLGAVAIAVTIAGIVILSVLFLVIAIELGALGLAAWRGRVLSKRFVIALAVVGSISALSMLQDYKGFYEAKLIMPLLMMTALIGLSPDLHARHSLFARRFGLAVICLSLVSQAVLWRSVAPHLDAFMSGGYIAGQGKSFSAFDYDRTAAEVLDTARLCGLPASGARHLVIDDLTYPALAGAYRPFHISFISNPGAGMLDDADGTTLLNWLAGAHAAGIVAGCHLLPEDLRVQARRNGPFCCIPAPGDAG